MEFFRKLFGRANDISQKNTSPYFDAVFDLIKHLEQQIPLAEWQNGIPSYTELETKAIEDSLDDYNNVSEWLIKNYGSSGATLNPIIMDAIKMTLGAERLKRLADGWKQKGDILFEADKTDIPDQWKCVISTYLKVWMMSLNPFDILDVADLLARAGRPSDATMAINAELKFVGHAATHLVPQEYVLADAIVGSRMLFFRPYESHFEEECRNAYRSLMYGGYSYDSCTVLRRRRKEIQMKIR
jgi:hypothetical protein